MSTKKTGKIILGILVLAFMMCFQVPSKAVSFQVFRDEISSKFVRNHHITPYILEKDIVKDQEGEATPWLGFCGQQGGKFKQSTLTEVGGRSFTRTEYNARLPEYGVHVVNTVSEENYWRNYGTYNYAEFTSTNDTRVTENTALAYALATAKERGSEILDNMEFAKTIWAIINNDRVPGSGGKAAENNQLADEAKTFEAFWDAVKDIKPILTLKSTSAYGSDNTEGLELLVDRTAIQNKEGEKYPFTIGEIEACLSIQGSLDYSEGSGTLGGSGLNTGLVRSSLQQMINKKVKSLINALLEKNYLDEAHELENHITNYSYDILNSSSAYDMAGDLQWFINWAKEHTSLKRNHSKKSS